MNNTPNRIIGYRELHNQGTEKNETKNKLTTVVILGTIAIAAFLGVKSLDKTTEYTGTKPYTFEEYQGLNDATMAVNRDPNQVPYQEVTEYIKNMPENKQALSDGIQPGEIITIPDSVSKK